MTLVAVRALFSALFQQVWWVSLHRVAWAGRTDALCNPILVPYMVTLHVLHVLQRDAQ
jgi:hypothetical protein